MKAKIYTILFVVFVVLLINHSELFSQWVQLTTGTTENLQDIYFANVNTGFAVGNNGKIIRTTNAGENWVSISSGVTNSLNSIDYPENMTLYVGGQSGTVLRTENCGGTWTPRPGCSINVRSIAFVNYYTGITAGGGTLMCYTTNGGTSWGPKYIPSHIASGVTFLNSTTLLVCATDMPGAVIFKSTNSGTNWSTVMTMTNSGTNQVYTLSNIYFKNSSTGYCTGSKTFFGQSWGVVYRTTNGGDNWEGTGSTNPASGSGISAVHFGDNDIGFAAGNNGVIMRSTNAGVNWSEQSSTVTLPLSAIYMLNALTGYACGGSGTLLKTTNGGVVGFVKPGCDIPIVSRLHQNFPNPFNPVTKINYELNSEGHVKLVVFDLSGKEIIVLVNEYKTAGLYEIELDGSNYPSGVYFCKMISDNYSETKKLILIK